MDDYPQPDDIDRLFARLTAPALPSGIIEQSMLQATSRAIRRKRLALALVGYASLLSAITLLAFAFGRSLVAGGADRILTLAILEPAAVGGAPRDFLWAVLESVPWHWLAALLIAFAILAWSVRYVAALYAGSAALDPRRERIHA
jgi:hypothetical protein